jgi:CheY-like chemotaxis protein
MKLQILIIEDDPNDVIRIEHELARGGLNCRLTRVETRGQFLEALHREPPQVILSDHGLPSFDGFTALDLAQKHCPHIPFVFVTASFSQSMLVEMFEGGASGYVYKNRMGEIVPAVRQALANATPPAAPTPETVAGGSTMEQKALPIDLYTSLPPISGEPICVRVICPGCKRLRNEAGAWEPIELYLQKHAEATVSLMRCPDCQLKDFKPVLYRS